MKLFNFAKLFGFGNKSEVVVDHQQIELEAAFISKIKELRFDFVQTMLDNGFVPSQAVKDEVKTMLLIEIVRNQITINSVENPLNGKASDIGCDVFKPGLQDDADIDKRLENTINLLKIAALNDFLDFDFLERSQDLENTFKTRTFLNHIDETSSQAYMSSREKAQYKAFIINHVDSSVNLNISEHIESRFEKRGKLQSMFSMALDLKPATSVQISNLKPKDNILQKLNNKIYDLPLSLLFSLKDSGVKKQVHIKAHEEGFNKGELNNLGDLFNTYNDSPYLAVLLASVVPHIIRKEVESNNVKPEDLVLKLLSKETKMKELSFLVVKEYPECLVNIPRDKTIDLLDRMSRHLEEAGAYTSEMTVDTIKKYIEKLKNLAFQKDEFLILDKLKSSNQSKNEKTGDYIAFAKSLSLPSNLMSVLLLINEEVSSLSRLDLSVDKQNDVKGLEENLIKSLKMFSDLKELGDSYNKDNSPMDYLSEPFSNILQSLKEIKEQEIKERIDELSLGRKRHIGI